MEGKNDGDKNIDDFMLPGFRFHPTDEELVGFYLKRKLQQRSLPIDLIKQLDIYKYDPWDLPKLASTGEKEWYFYCPRDRKYRNSTRPNRVTGSGFWKATGTDRPIYSSDGTKCIGLKKSLVFYRGRAARGIKTDWMMHEFRLPSTSDKSLPPIDSWAICRIFKKANSMVQRALSHSWAAAAASLSETTTSLPDAFTYETNHNTQFNSTSETELQQQANNFIALNIPPCKTIFKNNNTDYFPSNFLFSSPEEISGCTTKNTNIDLNSMLFKLSPSFQPLQNFNGYSSASSSQVVAVQKSLSAENEQGGLMNNQNATNIIHNTMWGNNIRSMEFPFSLPEDSWNSPPSCPSEISSTTYSSDKCYA